MSREFHAFSERYKRALNPGQHELIREKIVQVWKGYCIETSEVKSLLHYLSVPKGLSDIRMVYNGTGCGLNEAVWSLHFGLPTVRQTLCSLLPGYQQCDMDVREVFLHFLLYKELKQMSGVDVINVRSWEDTNKKWES